MSIGYRIRPATSADRDAIVKLLHVDDVADLPLPIFGKHELLVAEAPDGGVAAAAIVRLDHDRAQLRVCAIAKGHEHHGLEEQISKVAEALGEVRQAVAI
jgi:hypothetical protein